ncbi:MAG: hypothetical protein NPIRA02_42640 [Nitrospirales bacterium]|nr:MAG: hypothetical protein NPIRA02_42640 [Nitrospirales bacterium]
MMMDSRNERNFHKVLVLTIVLFWSLCLTSCSSLSLSYRYADWLLYWKIDGYIDLTSDQQPFLQEQLATLQQWHRDEELPRYILFLDDVKRTWQDGLTQAELEILFQQFTSLWKSLGQRFAAEGTPLLTKMTPAQIQNLKQTMREENQTILKKIGATFRERMEKRLETVFEELEDWLGPLTSDQKLHIARLIRKFPDTTHEWILNRQRRQANFLALLQSKIAPSKFEQQIFHLLVSPEKGASQAYLTAAQQRISALFSTILEVDHMITPQQREHASHRFEAIIQELQNISRN